jgi:hypothetical protein
VLLMVDKAGRHDVVMPLDLETGVVCWTWSLSGSVEQGLRPEESLVC